MEVQERQENRCCGVRHRKPRRYRPPENPLHTTWYQTMAVDARFRVVAMANSPEDFQAKIISSPEAFINSRSIANTKIADKAIEDSMNPWLRASTP